MTNQKSASRNKSVARKILSEVERCELCGSKRGLEVHHIIPLSVRHIFREDLELDLDCEDNMIVTCGKCHALLTPRSMLIKTSLAPMAKKRDRRNIFYEKLEELSDECLSAEDVIDIFNDVFMK